MMSNPEASMNAPSLAILNPSQPHTFVTPLKRINEGHDVPAFLISKAYGDIMTFLLQLNRASFPCLILNHVHIWELKSSENIQVSKAVIDLGLLISTLDGIIDEVPPDPGPRRFGNASFRKWNEVVENRVSDLLDRHLPAEVLSFSHGTEATARSELESYFLGSFGSSQRLDYGSGHELSFLAFLGCIWKLGGFCSSSSEDRTPPGNEERCIVLGIIEPYLRLIRRLIKTYTLEPAGSHGVWGLDDHSFLPYIFGSAQYGPPISPEDQTPTEGSLEGAPDPADVAKITAVDRERNKNMYFGAIGFIHDVKKGPFWEHSPMLYDISGVRAGWGKINKGMIKMYNAEVLSKFPVVQHFRFGSLFSWDQDPNATPPPASVHTSNQPIRDGPGLSLENASSRGLTQDGTKTPWANRPVVIPIPSAGTAAPWASRLSVTARTGMPPSRFPQSNSGDRRPPAETTQIPLRMSNEASDAQAMPPPTKAPWAK